MYKSVKLKEKTYIKLKHLAEENDTTLINTMEMLVSEYEREVFNNESKEASRHKHKIWDIFKIIRNI